MDVRTVTVSAGSVEYLDTGGTGPVVVLLHGLLQDELVWTEVAERLAPGLRCVIPRLPFGAHHMPLRADADLSLPGMARLLGEFAAAADLTAITVAANDWGGAQVMAAGCPERIARLVFTPCEAFDNVPPGLPGRTAVFAAKNPTTMRMAARSLRVPALRRLPMTMGWMAKRMPSQQVFEQWTEQLLTNPAICRDVLRYAGQDLTVARAEMVAMTERLARFPGPALIAWASEDRVMPREHGPRLAALLPDARLEWVADSYVLMPLDQPDRLADLIGTFVAEPHGAPSH